MTGTEFCVLCASGEHRPESHRLRTMTLFSTGVGDDEDLVLSLVEHYRIIDERLPYSERFKVEHYTLNVLDGHDEDIKVSSVISETQALGLARRFLGAVVTMRETR